MKWVAQAPSNIALIKYMGKMDTNENTPTNSSLSYTLNHLFSTVELEQSKESYDRWEPLNPKNGQPAIQLNTQQQQRFLKHLAFLKQHYQYDNCFIVRSYNNFPQSTGLASSASSFAALTQCVINALTNLTGLEKLTIQQIAQLSRRGSGSSCRSFFSPWVLWTKEEVKSLSLPYEKLIHYVIILSETPKAISSTEAHKRVKSSPIFERRVERAEQRLQVLLLALRQQHWEGIFKLCWKEFQELHQLFATATPPFNYLNKEAMEVLAYIKWLWGKHQDGPIVTMDAGPNIHLLYRPDQQASAKKMMSDTLLRQYHVL